MTRQQAAANPTDITVTSVTEAQLFAGHVIHLDQTRKTRLTAQLNLPEYQRAYQWSPNDVKALLNDRNACFTSNTETIHSENAVEHIQTQHEKCDKQLHAFGNLVLLSPSENSPYSNQTVSKKQEAFKAKLVYDSLKLKRIFEVKQNDEWNEDKSKQHQKEMIDLIICHYKSTRDGAFNG